MPTALKIIIACLICLGLIVGITLLVEWMTG